MAITMVGFKLQVGGFATTIMAFGVTAVFISMGFLTTLVSILAISSLGLTGLLTFKGGS